MRILFLYSELAEYTIACLDALKKLQPETELMVTHFPINSEAPFEFDVQRLGSFISIENFPANKQFEDSLNSFNADKIICSGWINKWYLRYCFKNRNRAECILLLDNQWNGSLKQHLLGFVSRVSFTFIFKAIWIPGEPQREFANKLGFINGRVMQGFYSGDVDKFRQFYCDAKQDKQECFPKRFICVARYIPAKGYKTLWDAFVEWKKRTNNSWQLWCAGVGDGYDNRIEHPDIKHLGFVQKTEWKNVISQTGIFVLSSLFEPWGVAVHEFAAAGYPLLLSKNVGAASAFLGPSNGISFDPDDKEQLIEAFNSFSKFSDSQLLAMGEESSKLAFKITPSSWARTLLQPASTSTAPVSTQHST